MNVVTIYTDGACSGNPGPGGWGAVLVSGSCRKEIQGGERDTTNNRMELTAAIEALKALRGSSDVDLYTDSVYVRSGITEWIDAWKRNGWRRRSGKRWLPVKNEDLWRELDRRVAEHRVRFYWVEGHAGHPENERADELARAAIPST
ncbi:MAG: ribonuclease HI [Candidatus Bipolaricaulota bacterium]|nr:ribonuclease HI [Candidatus Bipolaricaulota bacterium]